MNHFIGGYSLALLVGLWVGMLVDYKGEEADDSIKASLFLAILGGLAAWGLLP